MKKILMAIVMLVGLTSVALSQVNLMSMAQSELQKRGLNEAEVRQRLMEEGIDVDNIPPTEYANYQGRVTNILNKMQAEKAAERNRAVLEGSNESTFEYAPQTTEAELESEQLLEDVDAMSDLQPQGGPESIYGHSIFTPNGLNVFRTTDGAQAPDSYVLGEGDEVHISIFGSSQTEMHQRIGVDGSIQPAGSAKIFLKGMTLAQGREAIRTRLSQHFSFRPDQIAVTITTARTVTVSIYGEVGLQGGYTLSALNTAFNALAAAGGPTAIGSVRDIQLSRGGRTYQLDLYKYMTNPTVGVGYDVQNGDVLFVPVAKKVVRVMGAVNRPMRYEMIEGETLADLIEYAGGLTWNAYPDFVQIERVERGEVSYREYRLDEVMSGAKRVELAAGDVVRIKASNQPAENYVAIGGDVYYDGRFDLSSNTSLRALLDNAKPRYTARLDYLFVERTRPDETIEVLTVPVPGVNGNPDFVLQARDSITVLEQSAYRDIDTITVSGEVRKPFSRPFGLNDRMTVAQAIEYAGGLRSSVYPVAYIFRRDVTNPNKMQYLRVELDTDGDKLLQPGDSLNVYDNSTYANVGEVRIYGAVKAPFGTAYDASLSIHDLIGMAGGLTEGADYNRIEVLRTNIGRTGTVTFTQLELAVDDNYNLVNAADFRLQPYDKVVVRLKPDFNTGRVVELNGRVRYPGAYLLLDGKTTLSQIIKQAGGLLDDADPYSTLMRTTGRVRGPIGIDLKQARSHRGNIAYDPILQDGDVINVMRQENTVSIRELGTHMSQYAVVDSLGQQGSRTVVYKGKHTASWYIRHHAGGFDRYADRNSVTVTLPNGQMEGVSHFLFFRRTPTVQPGSIITLRLDTRRRERAEQPKEKVDWVAITNGTLTTLTSLTTIFVLLNNIIGKNNN